MYDVSIAMMYACKVVTGIVIRSTNHNLFNWLFIFARMNNHHRLNHTMLSAQPEHKNFDSQCLTTHDNSSVWNLRCPLLLFVLLLALSLSFQNQQNLHVFDRNLRFSMEFIVAEVNCQTSIFFAYPEEWFSKPSKLKWSHNLRFGFFRDYASA